MNKEKFKQELDEQLEYVEKEIDKKHNNVSGSFYMVGTSLAGVLIGAVKLDSSLMISSAIVMGGSALYGAIKFLKLFNLCDDGAFIKYGVDHYDELEITEENECSFLGNISVEGREKEIEENFKKYIKRR